MEDIPSQVLNEVVVNNSNVIVQIVIILVCIIGSFLFSASENSFANCNKFHFKVRKEAGSFTGKLVSFVINKYDDFLITGLIGNNLVAVVSSSISTVLFLNLLGAYTLDNDTISIISTLIMTAIVYLFGDMLPKFISKAIPNKMASFLSYILFIIYIIFFPIVIIFKGLLFLIKKVFRIKPELTLTEDEFKIAAKEVEISGILENNESEILAKAFYFDRINVDQVLTPIESMVAINIKNMTATKLNKMLLNTTYSRIPVYEGNIDNIIGVLTIRQYFKEYFHDPHFNIYDVINDPYFVNYNDKIDTIFEGFNTYKTHIAFVKNKEQKVIGMITMDDVLEELVGDIELDKEEKL